MGCVVVIFALLVPRFLMFFIWLLTDWFTQAYATWVWPVLGFIFMPYTTLAYMGAMVSNNRQLSGGWLAVFIVAIIVDAGHWGGASKVRRRR